jgi:tetratricopeptide (TPR) repeat protein
MRCPGFSYLIIILVIFLSKEVNGLSYTDSIANRISYTTNDTLKLKGSIDLAKYFIEVNADSCSFWANRALQLAKQFENTEIDAQVFKDMGQIFFQLENYGRSITYYFEALRIHEKANDTILLISDQFNIALIYDMLGEKSESSGLIIAGAEKFTI